MCGSIKALFNFMPIRVVPIADQHIESYWTGFDSVAREGRFLSFLEAPPLPQTRKFVARNMEKGYPHCVALDGARVVGWCDVVPIDRPTRSHTGVLGIGVLAEYRGRGIGSALLRATIERARAAGLTRLELTVREPNKRVVALYEKFGFVLARSAQCRSPRWALRGPLVHGTITHHRHAMINGEARPGGRK